MGLTRLKRYDRNGVVNRFRCERCLHCLNIACSDGTLDGAAGIGGLLNVKRNGVICERLICELRVSMIGKLR